MENIFVFVSGHRLSGLREKKGLGQANFGTLIGKSRQTINSWESKTTIKMDRKDAEIVAKTLGVALKDLIIDKTKEVESVLTGKAELQENYESMDVLRKNIEDLRKNLEDLRKNLEDLRKHRDDQDETIKAMEASDIAQDKMLDEYRKELEECEKKLNQTKQANVK